MKRYYARKKNCNNCCNKPQFNFSQKKENVLCSLYSVENFLCQFSKALKCLKLYDWFK